MIKSILFALSAPSFAAAFSFVLNTTPQQCQNLSVAITGNGGVPPYNILIIPFGPSPLPNNIEARRIVNIPFTGSSSTLSFQLDFPANSQFVAVVSDSTAFGSGGTSVATTVQTSSDASCFNPTANVSPDFTFSIDPQNQIIQCTPTRIFWDPTTVQGTPQFLGVIPGGNSFTVPEGTLTNVTNEGTGFSWTPSVRGGTTFILIGGDNRGQGTGGSVLYTVSQGDNSCLDNTSPSSTPGSPAGGTSPTASSSPSSGGSSPSSNDTAAIAGGVAGGIAALLVLLLIAVFLLRRRSTYKSHKERPVDLLQGDEGDGSPDGHQLPQYYQPEPFMVAEPSTTHRRSSSIHDEWFGLVAGSDERSHSRTSMTRSGTPDMPATVQSSRKSASGLRPMRLVNIVQHDDAGPSESAPRDEEPETIELPPAYTNLKK